MNPDRWFPPYTREFYNQIDKEIDKLINEGDKDRKGK